ncbi:hypothetical protein AWB69_05968 [Caballeronia udeis]|uniref:Uncharacterized protein n=1 Tax=Caballeronia udeis TaxID=1232866 RepID=A0A158IGE5_9BURK|nr:hypothetical protein [Caballeronia udeis]SAL55616.1 hypothetical protein AWB69_05968 [Caballeronia udeis]
MSNNAPAEVVAVHDAEQFNCALDKPDSCAIAPAKQHRTAVGLPSDSDRHYTLAELKACGFDALAATIVHHVAYNTKRHKCAKAYTSSYWMEFFGGCSKQQARTAVKNALAAKIDGVPLLQISHGYFAKVWSPHYLYVGPGVDFNTPWHADINTPSTEGNQQKVTKVKKDLEDSTAQKTGSAEPSKVQQAETGKGKSKAKPTPDAVVKPLKFSPKAGEFLHMAFRTLQQQYDMPFPELGSLLHVRDCASAEAIGWALQQLDWNEQRFAKWITTEGNWHEFDALVQPLSEPNPVVRYLKIGYLRAHLAEAFALYQQHLDVQKAKYTSSQQIKLNAIAPQAMKLPIPLYEENPSLVAAMFGHADYWHEQQTDGLLGGKTLAQYLASWQWITPAMLEWLDNEAVRERVEELLAVHDTAAA